VREVITPTAKPPMAPARIPSNSSVGKNSNQCLWEVRLDDMLIWPSVCATPARIVIERAALNQSLFRARKRAAPRKPRALVTPPFESGYPRRFPQLTFEKVRGK